VEDGLCQVSRESPVGRREFAMLMDSFKGVDGSFGKPVYTIPDPEDGDAEEAGEEVAA
jgi:hypothetical protein